MIACLLTCTLFKASSALCGDRAAQKDPELAAGLANCDARAEQDSARVRTPTPINPTSALNPILLLNDVNRRKQDEANQPQLLNQIELERQRCRQTVTADAARRAQEAIDEKADIAAGYMAIEFEVFVLDAKSLVASEARIAVIGSYVADGNREWLFPNQGAALQASTSPGQARNSPKIPLLTEDASRDFRKFLLKCKSTPGADRMGCPVAITGYVSQCSMTGPFGSSRALPCLIVDNGRPIRGSQ